MWEKLWEKNSQSRKFNDFNGHWRREWDSNPRYAFTYTRFPSVRLKPLGHLSSSGAALPYRGRWGACKPLVLGSLRPGAATGSAGTVLYAGLSI